MSKTFVGAVLFAVFAGAALAQAPTTAPQKTPAPEKPIDKGPYTAAASGAYQGGGVVLQGAPGAPAPRPQPTPPGQAPAGAVPQ